MVAGLTQELGEALGEVLGEAATCAAVEGVAVGEATPESKDAPQELTRTARPTAIRGAMARRVVLARFNAWSPIGDGVRI